MGKYGGELSDFGQTNSLFGKNIEAYYRAPKEEQDFSNELDDYENMSISDLKALIPDNWYEENNGDYWEDEKSHFWGKDGQTNAYVKRGVDDEVTEPLDRMQINQYTWHFATDDNHIYFKAGGKIYARGKEWFLIKVITQDSTSSMTNKFNAMDTNPDNKRLLQFGLKTLVLI